jgi:Fic family protein
VLVSDRGEHDGFAILTRRIAATPRLERPELLNERQRGVIEHLKMHPSISTEEYGNSYGCTARTARRDLSALAEMGIIAVKREG